MNKLQYRYLSKTQQEAYRASIGRGCYLFSIKKDGGRYKHPSYYDYCGLEKSPEDVIARLESLNPGSKWEVA